MKKLHYILTALALATPSHTQAATDEKKIIIAHVENQTTKEMRAYFIDAKALKDSEKRTPIINKLVQDENKIIYYLIKYFHWNKDWEEGKEYTQKEVDDLFKETIDIPQYNNGSVEERALIQEAWNKPVASIICGVDDDGKIISQTKDEFFQNNNDNTPPNLDPEATNEKKNGETISQTQNEFFQNNNDNTPPNLDPEATNEKKNGETISQTQNEFFHNNNGNPPPNPDPKATNEKKIGIIVFVTGNEADIFFIDGEFTKSQAAMSKINQLNKSKKEETYYFNGTKWKNINDDQKEWKLCTRQDIDDLLKLENTILQNFAKKDLQKAWETNKIHVLDKSGENFVIKTHDEYFTQASDNQPPNDNNPYKKGIYFIVSLFIGTICIYMLYQKSQKDKSSNKKTQNKKQGKKQRPTQRKKISTTP